MEREFSAYFENDGRGIVFVGRGVISGERMIQNTQRAYSPEVLSRLRYQLVDLRKVERMDITAEQIRRLAELDRQAAEQCRGAKIAIIASHPLTVGLSRIYSVYAQSPELEAKIFPTMEEARAWIEENGGIGLSARSQ